MSTGYKPEVQTTIPSKSIQKKKKKINNKAPTQIYQSTCAQSFLRAGSVLSRTSITVFFFLSLKNGISNTPLANATSLNTNGTAWKSFICYRWETFGVNRKKKKERKKKGILNIFFSNWESNDKQKGYCTFYLFVDFQNEVSFEREGDSSLDVTSIRYDHAVINTAHSYYCNPTGSQVLA